MINDNGKFAVPADGTDPELVGGFFSPRHGGQIVVAAPDGHASMQPFEAIGNLGDGQRRNRAPLGTLAALAAPEFSHTESQVFCCMAATMRCGAMNQ